MRTLGHIKLEKHFRAAGVRQHTFAARIKTTPATVSRWLSAKSKPNDEMKIALERLTNGAVPAGDWLVPEDAAA